MPNPSDDQRRPMPNPSDDQRRPRPNPSDDQRRSAALATAMSRFAAAEERFRGVYGLRLPQHLAVFAAFWISLDEAERQAMADLGLQPWGVSDYLVRADGLDRTPRDGLDERLHCRFRRDPAEFVTVLSGDSDGLHFGLWYDDPAEPPSFVAYNWARDSAETSTKGCATVLRQVHSWLDAAVADDEELAPDLEPLVPALEWFAEADAAARSRDGESRWAGATRRPGLVSISPALPPGSGDPRTGDAHRRLDLYRDDRAASLGLVGQARAELAVGQPAFALTVGAELHWLDRADLQQEARDLLVDAYRALDRGALAAITEVHYEHRDLRSVDVFG